MLVLAACVALAATIVLELPSIRPFHWFDVTKMGGMVAAVACLQTAPASHAWWPALAVANVAPVMLLQRSWWDWAASAVITAWLAGTHAGASLWGIMAYTAWNAAFHLHANKSRLSLFVLFAAAAWAAIECAARGSLHSYTWLPWRVYSLITSMLFHVAVPGLARPQMTPAEVGVIKWLGRLMPLTLVF